jgi:hypothetical protein
MALRSGDMLPNVEPHEFQVLGSLPVPGDELLASFDVTTNDETTNDYEGDLPGELLPRVPSVEPTLPSLGRPATENLSQ